MSDQWERLKDLFDSALNLPDKDRAEFLRGINAEDPALCAQLEHLINQHQVAGTFLQGDSSTGAFNPGESIAGRYQVVRQLERGGMGEVYEAFDTELKEKIALKTVHSDAALDSSVEARLVQELQLARKITHPNVCRVHDIGRHNGTGGDVIFFTMELLHGETLAARLKRERSLTPEATLEIARQVAEGIDAAHACAIVHRDLKPGNIMLTDNGRVVIMDFGLARDSDYGVARTLSGESRLFGTPGYISPEQVAGGHATRASDIYAFGVVLHEMLFGRKPTDDKRQATRDVSEIDPIWNDVILKCLQARPEDRFQGASDIIRALEEAPSIQELDAEALKQDSGMKAEEFRPADLLARPKTERVNILHAMLILALSAMALSAAWILTERLRAPVQPGLLNMTFTKLTSQPGTEYFPNFSPDGRSFIYASPASGNWDIYLQRIGGQNPINLTMDSPDDDTQPAFSANGDFIAFRSERGGGGIYVMGATGENVRRLTDFGYNPSWSPNGSEIVFADQSVVDAPNFRSATSALWAVNVRSGERRRVSKGDAVQPQWSPHGDRIAYWSFGTGINRAIWTIKPDGSDVLPVATGPGINWSPAWSPDGAYIYFSSDRTGNSNLWRVPIDERSGKILGSAERVTTGGGLAERQHAALSRDGLRIAYVEGAVTENVQKLSFDPSLEKISGSPEWVTRGSRLALYPDPSPDGQWLTFQSLLEQEDIFVIRSDGSGQRQLTNDSYSDRLPRWSPDGKRIAFYSNRSGEYEVWVINPDGSHLEQLTHSGTRAITRCVWSPDGKKLALFYSTGNATSILDIASQAETPLPAMADPNEHFNVWSWSPDGKWLAGYRRNTPSGGIKGLTIYSIEQQRYEDITDAGDSPTWLADNRRLLFENKGKLLLVDRISKKVRDVFVPPSYEVESIGQISRDNRTIYFSLRSGEADIWMIDLTGAQNPAR